MPRIVKDFVETVRHKLHLDESDTPDPEVAKGLARHYLRVNELGPWPEDTPAGSSSESSRE